MKTALTFEEEVEFHAVDDEIKFFMSSVDCFLFLPLSPDCSQEKTELENNEEK